MKIIYLINSLKNGGPVNMLYTLVKNIDMDKNEVIIVSLHECEMMNERDFSNICCRIIKISNKSRMSILSEVRKIVISEKPDIVHSHGGFADYINSHLEGNFKTLSTVHCAPDEDFIMKEGKIKGKIKADVFFRNLSKIDYPIACSETVANKIEKVRKIKIDFIRNGVDLYSEQNDNRTITKNELGIPNNNIVFLFCGYLSMRKNVQYLIRKFGEIERRDITLLILGDGAEYQSLKEESKNDNRIIMVGKVDNPQSYYKISDFFVSASLSEGLPLAVMEGMMNGLPALLSDIDSHIELKSICPDAIDLFSFNGNELVDLVTNITIDTAKKSNAKSIIYDYLNARRMANDYIEIYSIKMSI